MLRRSVFLLALFFAALCAHATVYPNFPPHKIAGNLYYVGDSYTAVFLVTTPQGNILLNTGDEDEVPAIKENVAKLGFKWTDTKIFLISQAHWDHNAGAAQVVKETGAKYFVMDGDVDVVESGGKTDFAYGKSHQYAPLKVDRVLKDGDKITLGGTTMVARKTPGHTKGCATYTMQVTEVGKTYNVVILGGGGPNYGDPGFELVNNKAYPQIVSDQRKSYALLKSLPCDIFLGAHGKYYGMEEKYPRSKTEGVKAWVDPDGYKAYIAMKEKEFEAVLKKQQAAKN